MSSIGFKCSSPLSILLGNPFDKRLSICLSVETSQCKILANKRPGELSVNYLGKDFNLKSTELIESFLLENSCIYSDITLQYSKIKQHYSIYNSLIDNHLFTLFCLNHLISAPLDKLSLLKWYENSGVQNKPALLLPDLNSLIGGMVWGLNPTSNEIQRVFLAKGYKIKIFQSSTSIQKFEPGIILPKHSGYLGSYLLALEKSNFAYMKKITDAILNELGQASVPGLLVISEIELHQGPALFTIWENDLIDKNLSLKLNGNLFESDDTTYDVNYLGCNKW